MDGWMAGWLAGWIDGWQAGWLAGWINGFSTRSTAFQSNRADGRRGKVGHFLLHENFCRISSIQETDSIT